MGERSRDGLWPSADAAAGTLGAIHDELALLAQGAKVLAHLVAEAGDDALDQVPGPGQPSARSVLAAAREAESALWRRAFEALVAGTGGELPAFDSGAWQRRTAGMPRLSRQRLLAGIALQRQANLHRLEEIPDAAWSHEGTLPSGETVTLPILVQRWVAADRENIALIERALGTTLEDVLRRRFAHRE